MLALPTLITTDTPRLLTVKELMTEKNNVSKDYGRVSMLFKLGHRNGFANAQEMRLHYTGRQESLTNAIRLAERQATYYRQQALASVAPKPVPVETTPTPPAQVIDGHATLVTSDAPEQHIPTRRAANSISAPIVPPGQIATLRNWQQDASSFIFDAVVGNILDSRQQRLSACLIQSAGGSGKTYMIGNVIARLNAIKYFDNCPAPYPVLIVTKASVVEQFTRDLRYQFGIDIEHGIKVTNYDALRSSFGQDILKRDIEIVNGEEHEVFKWRMLLHPVLIVWDECHSLKNENSAQSKIGQAVNDIPIEAGVFQVFMSATFATRIADTKCFTCACRADVY